jgi:protein disulfide-isomerase A1
MSPPVSPLSLKPWCGHCKSLEPEYEAAATKLAAAKSPIKLVKVDATLEDNKAVAAKYEVRGFPTLKIFRDGAVDAPGEYKGPRDAAGIISYLNKVNGPPSTELKTADEVAAFKEGKEVALIGVFASAAAKEFKAFETAAKALREDQSFAHIFTKGAKKEGGAALVPELKAATSGVVLFKTFDEPHAVAEADLAVAGAVDALSSWIAATATPALVELDQSPRNKRALDAIFKADTPKLLGFISKGHKAEAAFKKALTEASAAAKALRASGATEGLYDVIAVDPAANAGAVQFFGLAAEGADLPALAVHAPKANAKYVKAKAKAADVKTFLASFHAGKLSPHIKSEAPPKKNDGPVKIVTAKTYDSIVAKGKTTLLEVYAPWCGHCKTLAPIYEKVGAAFKGDKNVVIAKFDGTANDLPPSAGLEVKGFPTLALITPEGKVVVYTGDRTEEALIAFVKAGGKPAKAAAAAATEAEEEVAKDEL